MGVRLAEARAYKPANQVDPGSIPTRGNLLKSNPRVEDKILKIIIIVNWLMSRKAEKSKKNEKLFIPGLSYKAVFPKMW